jgi:hypothetical protein
MKIKPMLLDYTQKVIVGACEKGLSQKKYVDLQPENRNLEKNNPHEQKLLSKPSPVKHHRYLIGVIVTVEILKISHTKLVKIASN